jgi:hypothetical protein
MCTHRDRWPRRADRGGEETGRAGLPGRCATGLAARFGSLPFRQLAGPAGAFFLWPPKSPARTGTSPGGPR